MRNIKKTLCKIISMLLLLLIVVGIVSAFPLTATAATTTKIEKKYEIAVVFDNSGSMYQSEAWCRAKYAMEIFSSMLNYENGDRLRIYPMCDVATDGTTPRYGGSYSAIEISSKSDIDKISNLFTVNPGNTPFKPALEAYDYLKTVKDKEKWIIVLTDGLFNQIERDDDPNDMSNNELLEKLLSIATDDISVQYLGFGMAAELKSDATKHFYAKKSTDTSLKDDLIEICNSIFQRSILPGNRLEGNSLTLDLSMKNLIVFAQGSDTSITSLVDESGNSIKMTLDSGQRKYSDIKANLYEDAKVDETLAGQVVTFAACPKGKYTLTYSGADTIQFFYEPDVDIDLSITNSDGEKVDGSDDFISGEYTVTSRIVDSSTGEDVTSHELMGNNVNLYTRVKTSNDSEYTKYENGSKINFEPDTATDIIIEGEYLGKYKISSKDDFDLSWISNLIVKPPAVDFQIDANVLQPKSWFKTGDHDNWKPVRVSMSIDGQPLTDEQLNNTQLTITTSDELNYRCEPVQGESAYDVYIAQDENGNYVQPETGSYTLSASTTYVDEYGTEHSASDGTSFEIQTYSKFWRWLKWIIIILAIVGLAAFILTRKAYPNKIVFRKEDDNGKFNTIKMKIQTNGTMVLPIYSALSMQVERNTRLYQKFSKSSCVKVVNINPRNTVSSYSIRHIEYSRGADFAGPNGRPFKGTITNNTSISVTFNDGHGTINGTIKIN